MVSNQINRRVTLLLPPFGEVAHNPYATSAVSSAYAALVELQFGADDAVAARAYALSLNANRAAVRPTLGSVHDLQEADRQLLALPCTRSFFRKGATVFKRTL